MKFYSTNNSTHLVKLEEAILSGLAPDNGLYMPERIPAFSKDYFEKLSTKSFQEIAFDISSAFVENDIPQNQLRKIIERAVSFDAPLIEIEIEKNIFALELFHGPTLAFKDFGARFLSQVLGFFAQSQNREIIILVATSGDTGSAVANGFLNVPNTKVIVLYPSGKVSEIQEQQFTTLGQNITAIEVNGTFDDCQLIVKSAFIDSELKRKFFLTSANSINIARLIPQMFYYFYAWSRLPRKENVVFSVPSGNFGNLTAGLISQKMGLPIEHFIATTNINNIVPHYLNTSKFLPRPSKSTLSNAMDVGNPSNFARMLELYQGNHLKMKNDITGYSFTDAETATAMKEVFANTKYTLDPHGAVGYLGLKKYLQKNPESVGVFLETAHPAKFKEVVESIIEKEVKVPEKLRAFLSGNKNTIPCDSNYDSFKTRLLSIA
jgi:threonine synthase